MTEPSIDRRRLIIRSATIAGGLTAASALNLQFTESAYAAAPRVYTRAEWQARPPTRPADVLNQGPDHIIVHHTASANSTDYSLAHAFQLSRSIQNHHMDNNGWSDTGQQLTLSRGGYLMEGRNRSLSAINNRQHVVGAHVANHNSHTVGIENEGLYISATPTTALWNALVETCRWLCDTYGLDPHVSIAGHRDYNATQCPGDRLYGMLPQLRDEVAAALGRTTLNGHVFYIPTTLPTPRTRYDHGPAVAPGEPKP